MRPKIGADAPTVKPAPPRNRGRNGRMPGEAAREEAGDARHRVDDHRAPRAVQARGGAGARSRTHIMLKRMWRTPAWSHAALRTVHQRP